MAAMAEMQHGRFDLAQHRLTRALATHPGDLQLLFNLVNARCATSTGLDPALRAQVDAALRSGRVSHALAWRWLNGAMERKPACRGLDAAVIAGWIDAASANPTLQSPARRQDLAALRGRLALSRDDAAQARAQFDSALQAWPTPDAALRQAADLASHGDIALALGHLDLYDTLRARRVRPTGLNMPRLHDAILERQGYWDTELRHLRATLHADLERAR
jgi:hypothetical protein